jgi:heat shock protein HslJ
MNQESKFTAALEKAASYRLDENGLLYFMDAQGEIVLRFSRMAN